MRYAEVIPDQALKNFYRANTYHEIVKRWNNWDSKHAMISAFDDLNDLVDEGEAECFDALYDVILKG